MAAWLASEAEDNSAAMHHAKRCVQYAMDEAVTDRQREMLLLLYGEGINMTEIGERLGVDKSTVSRTIKRGEENLYRCLRYCAPSFVGDGKREVRKHRYHRRFLRAPEKDAAHE